MAAEAFINGEWVVVWFCPDHMTMMRVSENCKLCERDRRPHDH